MDKRYTERLEINKILSAAAGYASLKQGSRIVEALEPSSDIEEVKERLEMTAECDRLLFKDGFGKVYEFGDVEEPVSRAIKGSALSCGEILEVARLIASAREAARGTERLEGIPHVRALTANLFYDHNLELDIAAKIQSQDSLFDTASDKLYSIRSKIRSLNERIRSTLSEYITGSYAEYLQDPIVTIRNDRYVIPVKAENRGKVKGFVHDRSKSGATYFIEPEYVLELNNELITLVSDEKAEVEAILKDLSKRIGKIGGKLLNDIVILAKFDANLALAEYSYTIRGVQPRINQRGYVNIIQGRHPLIDKNKVVPVSLEIGAKYSFLLLSGANTGGKTVTLKMVGLFCLMACCGLFIPAAYGSEIAVFQDVFCDIGDSQSIEESLSTFSSHMTHVVDICNMASSSSLVLLDELGGGTNPDEGQAIAKAVVKKLLSCGSCGIITTHFTPLKEFAYNTEGIENASMEFDPSTLMPLYSIKIGLPGASNALAICKRLGLDDAILEDAVNFLSDEGRDFENMARQMEEVRVESEKVLAENQKIRLELEQKRDEVNKGIEKLNKEREAIARNARSETKRIVSEKTEEAKELLDEIEEIFKQEVVTEADLIKARTIKNKLETVDADVHEEIPRQTDYRPATKENIKPGSKVYIEKFDCTAQVLSMRRNGEVEVQFGGVKTFVKLSDLKVADSGPAQKPQDVKIVKKFGRQQPVLEINVIGLNVEEALQEVNNFIDRAVLDNLEEVKIIHGVGTGKLRNSIQNSLRHDRRVKSFRDGVYGEGEKGVTFATLK
ncbi:MAG: endonuclease MutS2 [Clostridia bacterium]|nr:endonuclease MutS2 [Clostridia bacterium]